MVPGFEWGYPRFRAQGLGVAAGLGFSGLGGAIFLRAYSRLAARFRVLMIEIAVRVPLYVKGILKEPP